MLHAVYSGNLADVGKESELLLADSDLAAKWAWEDTEGSVHLLSFGFLSVTLFLSILVPVPVFNLELVFPAAASEVSRA